MKSDEEFSTPPGTPLRRKRSKKKSKRRHRSTTISSSDDSMPQKTHKTSNQVRQKDVLKLLLKYESEMNNHSTFTNSNLNNVVPEFDPANRAQTIESWLRKVNECSLIYEWNEKQTIHFSLQKLVSLAKRWFETLPTVVYTWEEWQQKLKKAFPSGENYGQLLEEMLGRTSRTEESLREYFYDKLNLLNKCEISGKKAVDCVIYGIGDRSIRNGAQALNCTEPEDLLNFLCSQKPQPYIIN